MGVFSFLKSKNKEEMVLVFHVGSSFVKGALFQMQKSGIPKIIFTAYEPIVILEKMDIDQFFSLTLKSLSVVAGKISQSGTGSPVKIFCVLSSLWYGSQTRIIRFAKNTPFIFNLKLADSLIQKEINLFEKEHIEKYAHTGAKVLPIELKNMKTVLNGYETSTPLNQKAQELEMDVFISMSSGQFLDKVQEITASNFHRKEIKFSSALMVSFAVARDMFPEVKSFLLINIDGEITDIAMVKMGILSESISFPIGRNFITRGLGKDLSFTLDEASSLISLHKDGHAEIKVKKSIEPVINKLKTEWLRKFQESLANLSNDISIPSTLYITVDKDLADFFRQVIENEQFSQYTLTESKFKIVFLNAEILYGKVTLEKNLISDSKINDLIIDSIYINRFLS